MCSSATVKINVIFRIITEQGLSKYYENNNAFIRSSNVNHDHLNCINIEPFYCIKIIVILNA